MTMGGNGPGPRAARLAELIRESMYAEKAAWSPKGAPEPDYPEPLAVRKAQAIGWKFRNVPLGMWEGQLLAGSFTLTEPAVAVGGALPPYASREEVDAAAKEGLSVHSIVGHIVPDYGKLLEKGLIAIRDEALRGADTAAAMDSRAFYRSVAIATQAVMDLAERNADLCRNLACTETDPIRASELITMAGNLSHCPAYPPATFHQALQAVWLLHVAFQYTGNALAFGRLDQYAYPFLKADLEQGRLTPEEAQELVDCFFLKCNERSVANGVVRAKTDADAVQARMDEAWALRDPFAHTTQRHNVRDNADSTNHWLQNVIVGGVDRDGRDATNPLTHMCLEAFRRNQMTNPCLTVRLHGASPKGLVDRTARVLMTGGGLPAIFNDDAIIPSLTASGFPVEDARDYTNDGCWEVIVPGRTDFYFDRLNFLRCLEWALNRGRSLIDGKQEAPDPGDPSEWTTYGEVFGAFKAMMDYLIEGVMGKIRRSFGKRAAIAPTPLLSALMQGPMETGADMTAGSARYITYGLIAEGMSHVIDSLTAIKSVVFERGEADMAQVVEALRNGFEGHDGLRRKLRAAPKYGSNDPYADSIGQDVIDCFSATVKALNPRFEPILFLPGIGTFSWYIAIGEGVGATPDGRGRAEEVASNFSPSAGADSKGLTAAILSHAKMRMHELPVGSPLDLRVASRWFTGEGGMDRMAGLLMTFVQLGGNMLTLTVADTETLREAQREPEKHRNLRVRMGGWSAYFTMLSAEQQEHHIRKGEGL